ncbi:AAA family ATPase [Sinosporangium album]|nr:AAA family ATPase [Sinosporangium album]
MVLYPCEVHAMAATPASQASVNELRYPTGSLVMLSGLPGAGKSTLLERLYSLTGEESEPVVAEGGVLVIDSRQARKRWGRVLRPVPSRLQTPLVHTTHTWRVARAVMGGHTVVAHTRGTWPHLLYGFAWLARRMNRDMYLIMLDVEPETALAGQHARGRVISRITFARHCRRWRVLVDRASAGSLPPAAGVTVLSRTAAALVQHIRFVPQADQGGRPAS